ncbi:MAG: acetyl-CoA carboxylase biotin carboxyl carrier protein [Pyrinomonadaceae bacterium]
MSNTASAKARDNKDIVVEKKSGNVAKKQRQTVDPSFNMDELRGLADLVIEHGFTDFEFENENIRVRLSKMSGVAVQAAPLATPVPAVAPSTPAPAAVTEVADPDAGLHKITSPIVGTFYRSPGPDKDAYVSEGSSVSPESTVCIVEAMKLMNEIQAEVSGTVVKIYVENGQPVEYGQPLFGVKK